MEGWRARQEWVCEDGSPNIDALERIVGDTMVCVTDTRQQQDGCGPVQEMRLAEYLRWVCERLWGQVHAHMCGPDEACPVSGHESAATLPQAMSQLQHCHKP